ncbi:hypothetical protein CA262_24115 [Sphingobium sp. GW456-12-10-14-TSB1]|uniref:glycosyltransferase n=1 Tax=Sphingobium sp. GW456-12-10-14-TSB1 TaxID=1987165 RepID=UPI000A3A3768|nr:glycosyltransferase [Sphingobium sp. GW456-12-10-14-TSB1]OUC52654.1 hypothetical protein CA262_24115 [Sphingobium sp. GW456-12-10-14-TSB1]
MDNLMQLPISSSSDQQSFPVVGIVTPVRNRREWTLGFANMVARQDYPIFNLYIVDSHSTDGTPEALADLNLPFLRVISAPDSSYWSGATNFGVKQALLDGCEYILTINDDAIIMDDYLSRLIASVVKTDAKIIGSVVAYVDNPGRLWGVGAHNGWNDGAFLQLSMAGLWDDAVPFTSDSALLPVNYLCGNGSLFHRTVFEQIGLYDDRWTPHYHGDSELTMRAERAGIARWVSPAARVYNRFSEVADGGFAKRNLRFFSLKSANYAKATLYVLDKYCPPDLKIKALVRYYAKYIHQQDWRQWSKMLRVAAFMSTDQERRSASLSHFLPSTDQHLSIIADLEILLSLPDREFVVMAYAYLLRRAASDEEYAGYIHALAAGHPRENIIEGFLKSGEFDNIHGSLRTFMLTLLRLRASEELVADGLLMSSKEDWIVKHILENRLPPSLSDLLVWMAADKPVLEKQMVLDKRLKIYMNIDVLCMAMVDPKAATGVHRYVSNLLWTIADDDGVDVILFHSPRLAESCAQLIRRKGIPAHLKFAAPWEKPEMGLVFYPYFPLEGCDQRFSALRTVMTVCDIFPLTNPEWFSSEAVAAFRRQMHGLSAADHIICISKATQDHIRHILPGLSATMSFAHLGVTSPPSREASTWATGQSKPYFLCVGTIEPRKNLSSVISAMKLLSEEGVNDLEMLVVGQEGWSITSSELGKLAGHAAPKIKFLGRVDDDTLWHLYAGAVCTVFPSLAEGFGFPIVESFAAGTPVITGNGSSMAEIAAQGAILVDPLNVEEIAAAIRLLSTRDDVRTSLGREAAQVVGNFTWEKCAAEHLTVFKTLPPLDVDCGSEDGIAAGAVGG